MRLTAEQMAEIVDHAAAHEPTKYDTPYLMLCAAERQLLLAHVEAVEGELAAITNNRDNWATKATSRSYAIDSLETRLAEAHKVLVTVWRNLGDNAPVHFKNKDANARDEAAYYAAENYLYENDLLKLDSSGALLLQEAALSAKAGRKDGEVGA